MLATLLLAVMAQGTPYDVILTGGRIVDGTGAPAFSADLAIRDGRIAAIGRLRGQAAARQPLGWVSLGNQRANGHRIGP